MRSTEVTHLRQDFAPHNVEAEQQLLGALLLSGEYAGGVLSEAQHAGGVAIWTGAISWKNCSMCGAKTASACGLGLCWSQPLAPLYTYP